MTRAAFFSLALTLVFASSSCTKPRRVETPPTNIWARWAMEKEPSSLDWTTCRDVGCRRLASLVMEGLAGMEGAGDDRKIVPALAETWDVAEGRLIFHLRAGVRWSDGEPLLPAHFVTGWKRLLARCRETPEAQRLFAIVNAAAYCDHHVPWASVGIETPDARTIVLRLRAPDPQLPAAFADPTTWPVRPRAGPVLGRFVLEKWSRAGEIRFSRNARYYGSPAEAAGVVVRTVPSADARVQLYLEREIDLADDLPPAVAGRLAGHPELVSEPTANVVALIFNAARRPFQSSAVRQAFALALKKDEILSLMHWPHVPTDQLLPTPTPGVAPKAQTSKAQELLAKIDVASAHPTLALRAGDDDERELAENLQAQWIKNLEVKVDLAPAKARDAAGMTIARIALDPLRPSAHVDALALRTHVKARSIEPTFAAASDLFVTKELVVLPLYQETRSSLRRALAQNLRKQTPELVETRELAEN